MFELSLRKYSTNNTKHRQALLQTGDGNLYEATVNRLWGCGFHLGQLDKIIENKLTTKNLLGKVLVHVRELIKAGTDWSEIDIDLVEGWEDLGNGRKQGSLF